DNQQWYGPFAGGYQCYGFAKLAVYSIFGKDGSSYRSWKYDGTPTSGMVAVGYITNFSAANVQALLELARCGDILQFDTPKQHSMMVYSVVSDGIWVYDCNYLMTNTINLRKVSFGDWASKNSNRLTLLRADNYDYIDNSDYIGELPEEPELPDDSDTSDDTCVCTADYAGTYVCTTSYSLRIRSTHGTSGETLGMIPYGGEVTVLKAGYTDSNGMWAHVIYNGISGYACMTYLEKKTEPDLKVQIWVSDEPMGDYISTFSVGDNAYVCYNIFDNISGKGLNELFPDKNYTVTGSFYCPDGSYAAIPLTYENSDSDWFGFPLNSEGTYTYKVDVTGDFNLSHTNTFTVTAASEPETADKTKVTDVDVSGKSITLSWTPVDNAESYEIYVFAEPYGEENLLFSAKGLTDTSYTYDGIVEGKYSTYIITRPNEDDAHGGITYFEIVKKCQHTDTEIKDFVEATCTENGYTGDKYCILCGEKVSDGQAVTATGHTESEWKSDSTHHWKECTVEGCGVEIENSKAEHLPGPEATEFTDQLCTECGHVLSEYQPDPDPDPNPDPSDFTRGDVDLDGNIDLDDVIALLRHVSKAVVLTDSNSLSAGDVVEDGVLNMDDVVRLLRYVSKAIPEL
ncbi:MAG: SH3 domain-containing protein, partial [Clostridia bacterium]|nr:SH3 domain-containing protein [Clostridia bacterium]